MTAEGLVQAQQKMRAAGVAENAITVFSHYYEQLRSGVTGEVLESDITPAQDLPTLAQLAADAEQDHDADNQALARTVVIKLNGGLGTSMGMTRAKSLLPVRDGRSFLQLIVDQVLATRERLGIDLPLVLMNSFATSADTMAALEQTPQIKVEGLPLEFVQNQEPKLAVDDLSPATHEADPGLEWCPPGHGDLYTALTGSGVLQQLLDAGYRYASVSNADNLGATPSAELAGWFARSGAPFAMEVCQRTPADSKGGHLAVRKADGQLILREKAQVAEADEAAFSDIGLHRYFNTNNLWLDLQALAETMAARDSVLGLPMIVNTKTVDPTDASSTAVYQIETAMGAAIEVFEGSQAIVVPRERFLPVKTTNDLLVLRSDVYRTRADATLERTVAEAPLVQLASGPYKLIADFEDRFPHGAPSLREASSLTVEGDWTFGADVTVRGDALLPDTAQGRTVAEGTVLDGTSEYE